MTLDVLKSKLMQAWMVKRAGSDARVNVLGAESPSESSNSPSITQAYQQYLRQQPQIVPYTPRTPLRTGGISQLHQWLASQGWPRAFALTNDPASNI